MTETYIIQPVRPTREIVIPVSGTTWPILKAAFPLSEESWTQMLALLLVMKPGLVEPNNLSPTDSPQDAPG